MSGLKFPVEEFTTPNPVTASPETSIDDLRKLMTDYGIRHIPIQLGGAVVGIVSDRDLRVASGLSQSERRLVRAGDIMAPDPVTVGAGESLEDVAFQMSKLKIGSVIVNDEDDRFLGIFTVTDALNALIEIARASEKGEDMVSKLPMDRFSNEDLATFRTKLERRRLELTETESDVEREALRGFSEERTDEISHVRTHPADLGTEESEQAVDLSLAEGEIEEVQDIEDALVRMQNESYGVCEDCGVEISFSRLQAVPYARYCVRCESKHENESRRRRKVQHTFPRP